MPDMSDQQRSIADPDELLSNWCLEKKLVVVETPGDGNCLLHSVNLSLHQEPDHDFHLRSQLQRVFDTYIGLKDIWKMAISIREHGVIPSENEWSEICTRLTSHWGSRYHESLEDIHVLAVAHLIARPVIVLGERFAVSHADGTHVQQTYLDGVYLPLELPLETYTKKDPIVVLYKQGHFSALAGRDKDTIIPLSNTDGTPLLFRFSSVQGLDVLKRYTDVVDSEHGPGVRIGNKMHFVQFGIHTPAAGAKINFTSSSTTCTSSSGPAERSRRNRDPNKPSTSMASRKPHEEKEIIKYEQEGKAIKDHEFCKTGEGPTMFPPVPMIDCYIDKFPEGSRLTMGNEHDKQRQQDYAAEVSVFRALESLGCSHGRNMVVFHGFSYTHGQYTLFVGDHESRSRYCHWNKDMALCKLKNKEREGECDFVIVGPNYAVVLQIKHVISNDGSITIEKQKNVLLENLIRAREQVERTAKLIEKIQEHFCSEKCTTVLRFTSFPGFERQRLDEFQLDDHEKKYIIFKEDLQDFNIWWKNNVQTKVSSVHNFLEQHQKLEHVLLSLWYKDYKSKGRCNIDKCSLGHYFIIKIDNQLKDANVTFRRREHENPAIIQAPELLRLYIGINNLTVEQDELYNSTNNSLWINGTVGSGKSFLMLGKIIQVAKCSPEKKVVLFKFGETGTNTQQCHGVLNRADIVCKFMHTDDYEYTSRELSDKIHQQSSQVVVVVITQNIDTIITGTLFTDMATLLPECHLLFDDIQNVVKDLHYEKEVADVVKSITELVKHGSSKGTKRILWIGCDLVQALLYYPGRVAMILKFAENLVERNLSKEMQLTLSVKLRNTWDISSMLSIIREECSDDLSTSTDVLNILFPTLEHGHYIYGPKPVIHLLPHDNENQIRVKVVDELNTLCQFGGLQNKFDIGIIYNNFDVVPVLTDVVRSRTNESGKISVCNTWDSYSSELSAVIVVHGILGCINVQDLAALYVAISRARTYCAVIAYPRKGDTWNDFEGMVRLFKKLGTVAQIIDIDNIAA